MGLLFCDLAGVYNITGVCGGDERMKYIMLKSIKKCSSIHRKCNTYGVCKLNGNKEMCMIPGWLYYDIVNSYYVSDITEEMYVKGW